MRFICSTFLLFIATPVSAGAPPGYHEDPRRERAHAAVLSSWDALGTRAIPRMLRIACGDAPTAAEFVSDAEYLLSNYGVHAIDAIYAYRGRCDNELGYPRTRLLSNTYARMVEDRSRPPDVVAAELARWATIVVDSGNRRHTLAREALVDLLGQPSRAAPPHPAAP